MLLHYPEWRNENAQRRYPFSDACQMTSRDGYRLGDRWLVDASFSVTDPALPLHIGRLVVFDNDLRIEIMDQQEELMGVGITTRTSPGPVSIWNEAGGWIGTLVPGPEAHHPIFDVGDRIHEFEPNATEFVLSTVFSLPGQTGVRSFTSPGAESLVSPDLVLVGDRGVQLSVEDLDEYQPDGNTVSVKLVRLHVVGDPQHLASQCQDSSRRPVRFIKQVIFQAGGMTHICTPDLSGNIVLVAATPDTLESALQVNSKDNRIEVRMSGKPIR